MRLFLVTIAAALLGLPVLAQERLALGFQQHHDTFERSGEVDRYSVRLERGNDYAIGAQALATQMTMRDPAGRQVGAAGLGEDETLGFEVRALATGRYILELAYQGDFVPTPYYLRVTPDCQAGPDTKCQLRPGRPQQRNTASAADVDWFRLRLKARNYRVRIAMSPTELDLAIVDQGGQVLAEASSSTAPFVDFRPNSAGTFFARVSEVDDDGQVYRIVLTVR